MAPQSRQTASQPAAARGARAVQEKKQKPSRKGKSLQLSSMSDTVRHDAHPGLSAQRQQSILNVFTQAFATVAQKDDLLQTIQEVKGHLYDRDFSAAFGKQTYLEAYALRWSAARALAYAEIFTAPNRRMWFIPLSNIDENVPEHGVNRTVQQPAYVLFPRVGAENEHELQRPASVEFTQDSASLPSSATIPSRSDVVAQVKVMCIGGGAGAEIVALAATSQYLTSEHDHAANQIDQSTRPQRPLRLEVLAIDIADWSVPVHKLASALNSAPSLPNYASQAARDNNRPLVDPNVDGGVAVTFRQQDILSISLVELQKMIQNVALVTIMFTLNELFSVSIPKTTALLLNLTETMDTNTHLVVVDSPGSYSEIKLGNSAQSDRPQSVKKYPMKWLLDHTLLDVVGKGSDTRWVKVEDEDSKWFRIDGKLGLKYGIDLENCRYQIHVFRKLR